MTNLAHIRKMLVKCDLKEQELQNIIPPQKKSPISHIHTLYISGKAIIHVWSRNQRKKIISSRRRSISADTCRSGYRLTGRRCPWYGEKNEISASICLARIRADSTSTYIYIHRDFSATRRWISIWMDVHASARAREEKSLLSSSSETDDFDIGCTVNLHRCYIYIPICVEM